jgi:hypothetical protein
MEVLCNCYLWINHDNYDMYLSISEIIADILLCCVPVRYPSEHPWFLQHRAGVQGMLFVLEGPDATLV